MGLSLQRAIHERRIIVCVGSGGVGKTTTSAVIALHAAIEGRRVLVCTIDPAKRLANSLGVDGLDDQAREISLDAFRATGVEARGQLFAMMLDMKQAFDRLVDQNAPDRETRERIYSNRFYKYFSTSLAGTQEYSAMERVYELYATDDYDLIVLDTPPTANALDFLEAPKRLFEALDSSAFQWIAKRSGTTGRFGLGLVKVGAGAVVRVLSRFTGTSFLTEFSDFIMSFGSMWEDFKLRAEKTKAILSGDETAFFIVASPSPVSLDEARYLEQALTAEGIEVGGFVVNRVHQTFVPQPVLQAPAHELAARMSALLDDTEYAVDVADEGALLTLCERMQHNVAEFHVLALRDAEELAHLESTLPAGTQVVSIPFFSTDIYSISGLNRVRQELFEIGEQLAPAQRTLGRL